MCIAGAIQDIVIDRINMAIIQGTNGCVITCNGPVN